MNAQIRLHPHPALLSPAPERIQRILDGVQDPLGLRSFVIRTFMYLAYAELSELPFAPDSARSRLLDVAITREQDLASQLRTRLSDQWKRFPTIGAVDLRERVSPFAAVILERCKGDRRAIPFELVKLRDELRPIRERLGEFEQAILFGKRDRAVQAEQKWNQILDELVLSFGPSPKLVSLASGLRLAESAAEIFDRPRDLSVWSNALKLPLTVLVRFLRRQPVAQLHKLRAELPAAGRLVAALHRVFPETAQLRLRN